MSDFPRFPEGLEDLNYPDADSIDELDSEYDDICSVEVEPDNFDEDKFEISKFIDEDIRGLTPGILPPTTPLMVPGNLEVPPMERLNFFTPNGFTNPNIPIPNDVWYCCFFEFRHKPSIPVHPCLTNGQYPPQRMILPQIPQYMTPNSMAHNNIGHQIIKYPPGFESNHNLRYAQENLAPSQNHEHIKKPLNAFMLYMREVRSEVLKEVPHKDSTLINTIIGERWQKLTEEEKVVYFEKAKEERERHKIMYPQYNPREHYNQNAKRRRKRRDKSGQEPLPKKCRARYGVDQQDKWCKHCKRKKKCLRYAEGTNETQNSSTDNNANQLEEMYRFIPSQVT
ncbi:Protein pangolin, isoforms A/H/I/S [Thelohanellus kitauei]|uniref:Protein pangolin, isoforms A/H/I/S n=1 Tax=Thelohanellus kitauei TaxID=669202 RepID=A0A0C2JLW9_THEKT|nr:Protein pangolin, isoforms A/H/I/S [Thelohanellus kitauei]